MAEKLLLLRLWYVHHPWVGCSNSRWVSKLRQLWFGTQSPWYSSYFGTMLRSGAKTSQFSGDTDLGGPATTPRPRQNWSWDSQCQWKIHESKFHTNLNNKDEKIRWNKEYQYLLAGASLFKLNEKGFTMIIPVFLLLHSFLCTVFLRKNYRVSFPTLMIFLSPHISAAV